MSRWSRGARDRDGQTFMADPLDPARAQAQHADVVARPVRRAGHDEREEPQRAAGADPATQLIAAPLPQAACLRADAERELDEVCDQRRALSVGIAAVDRAAGLPQ